MCNLAIYRVDIDLEIHDWTGNLMIFFVSRKWCCKESQINEKETILGPEKKGVIGNSNVLRMTLYGVIFYKDK